MHFFFACKYFQLIKFRDHRLFCKLDNYSGSTSVSWSGGHQFRTNVCVLCLRSQSDSLPAWGRRQKPLLPCNMGGKPWREVPLGTAGHQEGVWKIHCTDKDWAKPVPACHTRWWLCCDINHNLPWVHLGLWVCLWLHLKNACKIKCRFLVCCLFCFSFFPFSESTIEHYRTSSAGCLGSVLPLGLSGVLHFACNSALFATCKCSLDFWNHSLNLHREAELSYTFFVILGFF